MNHARSNPEGIVRAGFEALDVSASNKCSGRKGRREMERQDGREIEGEGGRDSERERERRIDVKEMRLFVIVSVFYRRLQRPGSRGVGATRACNKYDNKTSKLGFASKQSALLYDIANLLFCSGMFSDIDPAD